MLDRPKFRNHWRVEVVPGEAVLVIGENETTALTGEVFEHLAPLLDGRWTADQIVDRLGARVDPATIYFALMQLESAGHLGESGAERATPDYASPHVPAIPAGNIFGSMRFEIVSLLTAPPIDSVEALGALGIESGDRTDVMMVLTEDYLDPRIAAIERTARETRTPWVLAKPVGEAVWLGPVFTAEAGPCWYCLAHSLRANRPVEAFLSARRDGYTAFRGVPHSTPRRLRAALTWIAMELARWLAEPMRTRGEILTVDGEVSPPRRHVVRQRPHCETCGIPRAACDGTTPPITIGSQTKLFTSDGGFRVIDSDAFVDRHLHLLSPITGIAPSLRRVPLAIGGAHVFAASINPANPRGSIAGLRRDLRSFTSGKGVTEAQARASALGEAAERRSGVFQGDEPRIRATARSLGTAAIRPNECMCFSETQYRERSARNALGNPFARVPMRFDPAVSLDWTPAWSLTRGEVRLLPTSYVYYGHPEGSADGFCWADSNGCAAGATREEAILQGLLELVERDAIAIWWYNRVPRPRVADIGPYGRELRGGYEAAGREFWLIDLTTDLGIPVIAALTRRLGEETEQLLFGFGAHLDPEVAVTRALSEMNQLVASLGAPRDESADFTPELSRWLREATLANQPHFAPRPGTSRRGPAAGPFHGDLREDIAYCRSLIEAHGMEILVLDQTRGEIGIPVYRSIVPGLRPFWARFAPGRLYDVPVAMDWLPHPLTEEELNPIPVFF